MSERTVLLIGVGAFFFFGTIITIAIWFSVISSERKQTECLASGGSFIVNTGCLKLNAE